MLRGLLPLLLLLILLAPVAEASRLTAGKRYVLEPQTSTAELLVEAPANTQFSLRLSTEFSEIGWIDVRANSTHVWMTVQVHGREERVTLGRATFYSSIVLTWQDSRLVKIDYTLQSGTAVRSGFIYLEGPQQVLVTVYGADLTYSTLRGSVSVREYTAPQPWQPSLQRCQNLLSPPTPRLDPRVVGDAIGYLGDVVGCGLEVGMLTLTVSISVLTLSAQLLAYVLPLLPLAVLTIVIYYAMEKPHELPLLIIRLVETAVRLIRFIIELALRIVHIIIDLIPL